MNEVHGLDSQPNVPKEKERQDKSHAPSSGGSQGILNIPVEVFLEIGSCVGPGDLISLIQTNKFIRAMLLDRSAASVWQRSLSNVPDLPACPTGMAEPQYAALIFSNNCTICGVQRVTSMPDPFLRVRLCRTCRNSQLVEREVSFGRYRSCVPYTQHTKPANSDDPLYQLRVQKKEAKRMRNEFIRNDDDEGLARWNRQQHAAWDIQRREGELLLKYLYSAGSFPSSELRYLKTERQEKIHQRLKDLGWDEKYLNFWGRSGRTIKKWRSLVEVPAPLTGQTWVGILPELTKLLQVNRQRLDGIEWYQCLDRRRFKVEDLLRALQRDTDPYQPIINALQQLPPESMDSVKTRPVLRAPFPSIMTLVGWSCLVRLYIDENTLERVEGLFQERRDMISQKWLEWRTEREDQLIKQYKSSSAEGTGLSLNTMLTIKGSTEATKDLPANTRFLLRADTVLMKYIPVHFYTEIDREHGPSSSSVHFPFISGLHDYPYLWEVRWAYDPGEDERNIRGYVRYIGEEVIVKALLKELDMSDAAHIELEYMGKVFICGRCTCQETMGWDEIVDHYHANKRNWLEGRFIHNSFKTRHPVVFRNLHDLEPGASAKPLVRLGADTYTPFNPVAHCLICRWIEHFELCGFDSTERMGEHMVKMHDSAEPIEGLHFMSESRHCEVSIDKKVGMPDRMDWEKQWDEYHDARSAFKGETEARV